MWEDILSDALTPNAVNIVTPATVDSKSDYTIVIVGVVVFVSLLTLLYFVTKIR